jgi:hypothetical protein
MYPYESVVDSDDATFYGKLKDCVELYNPQVIEKKVFGKILPWVHSAISKHLPPNKFTTFTKLPQRILPFFN